MICSRLKTSVGRVKCPQDSEFDGRQPKRGARKLGEMLVGSTDSLPCDSAATDAFVLSARPCGAG
jgi:hypothetical protein